MGVTLKTMPSQAPFFLDAPTLQQATSAYLNNGLTEKAPDGYYSDGTIIRKLKDGKFITVETIPPCNPPCSPPMPITTLIGPNVYDMSIHTGTTGTSIGAIVIKFKLNLSGDDNASVGMEAELNGVDYYKVVNEIDGVLPSSPPGIPSWIDVSSGSCLYPGPNPITGNIWDWNGFAFVDSGFSLSYIVDDADVTPYSPSTNPGYFFMVVPKVSPLPEMLNIRAYVFCYDGTVEISASCPTLLPSIPSSIMVVDPPLNIPAYCALPLDQSIYYVKTKDDYPGLIEENTIVFKDQFGQIPLDDGYYKIPEFLNPSPGADTIYVDNGIITTITWDFC